MELVFTPLGKNVNLIKHFLNKTKINFCDISLGVKFMWRETVKIEYAIFNNTLILKETGGNHKNAFYYPIGDDEIGALEKIEEYCLKNDLPLIFGYLDEQRVALLQKRYFLTKNRFDRDWCDYIYLKENFLTYSGKKLSGQRNHVNKFKRNYPNYKFNEITEDNLPRVVEFLEEFNAKLERAGRIEEQEREHALELTKNMFLLNQRGGFIEVDEKIVAMSIGEKVNETLIIHVEKANTDYAGAYPTMAQEFAKAHSYDVKYINREEDCGDIGLRTSKSQYQPLEIKAKNFLSVFTLFDKIDENLLLNTERLSISKIEEFDKENYFKLYVDEELNKLWGYDYKEDLKGKRPTPDYFYNFQNVLKEKKQEISFAVRINKELIGELVVHNFDFFGGVEMGFRFFPAYQGKGYAFESASALKEYLFSIVKIRKLKGSCYKQNASSKKLIEKLGLKKSGEDQIKYYFELKND